MTTAIVQKVLRGTSHMIGFKKERAVFTKNDFAVISLDESFF